MNTASKKKTYRTLLALTGAALLSLPVAAQATPTYLDITASSVILDSSNSPDYKFSGNALTYVTSPSGGSQININEHGNPPGATFSLDYNPTLNQGSFSVVDNSNAANLLSGYLTSALFNGNNFSLSGQFDFTFSSASGSLNGNANWPGHIEINLGSASADVKANAPVPEPATLSLLALGGSALIGFRRRNSLKK